MKDIICNQEITMREKKEKREREKISSRIPKLQEAFLKLKKRGVIKTPSDLAVLMNAKIVGGKSPYRGMLKFKVSEDLTSVTIRCSSCGKWKDHEEFPYKSYASQIHGIKCVYASCRCSSCDETDNYTE